MNKHKIAWIALAVGIVVVLMLTWLVGVSPRLTHIKEADAQTAQIEESNKKTRDQIETLRMASETIGLQKDRLRQLQRQIPDGYNQNEFIDSLNAAADGGKYQPHAVPHCQWNNPHTLCRRNFPSNGVDQSGQLVSYRTRFLCGRQSIPSTCSPAVPSALEKR